MKVEESEVTLLLGHEDVDWNGPVLTATVARALERGLYFEFSGGLGDVVNAILRADTFTRLDTMQADDHAVIALICHNPHAHEVFAYHPKARQITIISLGYCNQFDPEHRCSRALPAEPRWAGGKPPNPFLPYTSRSDKQALATLPDRFVAFAATASSGRNEGRSIPESILKSAAAVCTERGLTPVFLGRRYVLTVQKDHLPVSRGHHDEADPPSLDGVLSVIDRLSVSGTLECIRRSIANVVCHSSMVLASWGMKRPTFLISGDNVWQGIREAEARDGTCIYNYPPNGGCAYGEYTDGQLSAFLDRALSLRAEELG